MRVGRGGGTGDGQMILELLSISVLGAEGALEVLVEVPDHGPLLVKQIPELIVLLGRGSLVVIQAPDGSVGRTGGGAQGGEPAGDVDVVGDGGGGIFRGLARTRWGRVDVGQGRIDGRLAHRRPIFQGRERRQAHLRHRDEGVGEVIDDAAAAAAAVTSTVSGHGRWEGRCGALAMLSQAVRPGRGRARRTPIMGRMARGGAAGAGGAIIGERWRFERVGRAGHASWGQE